MAEMKTENAMGEEVNVGSVDVDPAVLLDSIDEVNMMVDAHVNLLKAMKSLVWKFKKSGLSPEQATAVAFELHKRASNKANDLVPNGEPEDEVEKKEEKKDGDEEN